MGEQWDLSLQHGRLEQQTGAAKAQGLHCNRWGLHRQRGQSHSLDIFCHVGRGTCVDKVTTPHPNRVELLGGQNLYAVEIVGPVRVVLLLAGCAEVVISRMR